MMVMFMRKEIAIFVVGLVAGFLIARFVAVPYF
jgi:hypothetical protein